MVILQFIILVTGTLLVALTNGERASFPQTSSLCRSESIGSSVYRFHNETGKCHQVGEKGPCGDLMIFYADPWNDDLGECDCDFKLRCHRPMVYSPQNKRCYLAYEQGPCEENNYLVPAHDYEVKCEENPCKRDAEFSEFDEPTEKDEFWFHSGNDCILTGTQGLCPFSHQKTIFNGFSKDVHPICSHVTFNCTLPEIPYLLCLPGQKWFTQHRCGLTDPNLNPYFTPRFDFNHRQKNHHHRGHFPHSHHHRRHRQHNHSHNHHQHRHVFHNHNNNDNINNTQTTQTPVPLEPYRAHQNQRRHRQNYMSQVQ